MNISDQHTKKAAQQLATNQDELIIKALSAHLGYDVDMWFIKGNTKHLTASEISGVKRIAFNGVNFLEIHPAEMRPAGRYKFEMTFNYKLMNEAE